MRKVLKLKFITYFLISVVIMILIPWLVVTFINSDAAMAVSFLLFYAIYPLYATVIGMISGKNVRSMWSMPIIVALLFLIGTWIFFEFKEITFVYYALIYLAISVVVMLLSIAVKNKSK